MSDIVNTAPETKKPGRSGQIVLSLLIFAGFVVLMFVPAYYGFNDKSLWTVFLNLFKGEFKPEGFAALALYGTVAAYVVLLLCTVASMLTRRTAAVVLNYLKTVVMLAATVLMIFSFIKQGSVFADIFYAEKTFVQINATVLSVFFGVLALILLNFSVYKGIGAVKLVYTILAAAFFAFSSKVTFIGGETFSGLFSWISLGDSTVQVLTSYVFLILGWATVCNVGLALLPLIFPKTGVIDITRSVAMFLLCAAAFILLIVETSAADAVKQHGTLGFLILSAVQLIFAVTAVTVVHKRRKAAKAEAAEAAEAEKTAAEETPFVFDENDQMAMRGMEKPAEAEAAPAAEPAQPAQPAAPAIDPVMAAEAKRTNDVFEDAAQMTFDDLAATQEEPAPAAEPAAEAAAEPEPEKVEKPFSYEQAQYDSRFNREYTDYAQDSRQAQEQQAQQAQQAQYGQQPPYYANAPYGAAPYYGAAPQPNYYVPDAFLSLLTDAERAEFDRLFISRVFGDNKRLPAYRIGGDNREFFVKIFVFMGRYRNVISDGLLEKIYNYSNSIR